MTTVPAAQPPPSLDADLHAAYLRLVEERSGLSLSARQAAQLVGAIAALLPRTGYGGPADLYAALATGDRGDLLEALAGGLTVGETHFFRVAPQIEALRRIVLPDVIARCGERRRLRLWSAGCSTGEEPYTLAILLRELLPAPEAWDIQLLATDINAAALEVARRGHYGEWSFRGTPEEVRQRYFVPEGKGWRLVEQVRRMVRFAHLNLAMHAYPSPGPGEADLDVILCRNVTIYFSPTAAQRLYRGFAGALAPGGWLVLGPSDPTPGGVEEGDRATVGRDFELVALPDVFLWRRSGGSRAGHDTTGANGSARGAHSPARPPRAPGSARIARATPDRPARVRPAPAPGAAPGGAGAVVDVAAVWRLVHEGARAPARALALGLARDRPLEAEAHLLLGMLHLDEGALDAALESLRRATFLDKDNALAHFSLGRAYLQQGYRARAQAALTQARRLLAALALDHVLQGSGGLTAGELRHAVEAQLSMLRPDGAGAPARRAD
jgi:chemotaxis protein methyltransferase CheR